MSHRFHCPPVKGGGERSERGVAFPNYDPDPEFEP